ncbi:MAG: F0F1 ATP synthase subunit alpha, partial [Thermoleophilia bacterium]|nr:F0F1 ATP synthase subunit alpha [Thermoleophilia bacterium]
ELSQYRDLEAFAQFGSELDAATQATLARGERLVATLNQPQYDPWPVEEQVAIIFVAGQGHLDKVDPGKVPNVNEEIRSALRDEGVLLAEIRDGEWSDDLAKRLDTWIGDLLLKIGVSDVTEAVEAESAASEAPSEGDAEEQAA